MTVQFGRNEWKEQDLIIDTGSSMMIVPCKGCTECNSSHSNGLYDPEASDTCVPLKANTAYLRWICYDWTMYGSFTSWIFSFAFRFNHF